jgi:hypothetical protein
MVKNTCTVPPVPRANLLVGKLFLLHQTRTGFAKEFTHKRSERGKSLQCCNISGRLGKIDFYREEHAPFLPLRTVSK